MFNRTKIECASLCSINKECSAFLFEPATKDNKSICQLGDKYSAVIQNLENSVGVFKKLPMPGKQFFIVGSSQERNRQMNKH